ncbi:MAG: KOW domain-containing RNA-binding protein [Tissierellia bacterium]|nr:KOW domain-containing RNA-binding protein [Tissierellia bacterium]
MDQYNKLSIGQVVRSLKGRDAGKVAMVLDIIDSSYVLVVDGKRRTLEHPKKKKVKHLQPFNKILETEKITNKKIRAMLRCYKTQKEEQ